MFQRRISPKRDPGQKALECKEITELVKVSGLMRTVFDIGPCYEKLVYEFIINISIDFNV